MRAAQASRLPGDGTDPEALIREARRRQRQRYLVPAWLSSRCWQPRRR